MNPMRAVTTALACMAVGVTACAGPDLEQRRAEVAERGGAATSTTRP